MTKMKQSLLQLAKAKREKNQLRKPFNRPQRNVDQSYSNLTKEEKQRLLANYL